MAAAHTTQMIVLVGSVQVQRQFFSMHGFTKETLTMQVKDW